MTNLRYIAYVRKSEERAERQELSLQSQISKIKEYYPNIEIVKWMEPESKTAFKPGRSIFNEMLDLIDEGFADGIVCWHPNRLSRNEIDSAAITYRLRSTLKDLKFCTFGFDNSAEGIMMLQMTMNQSQYESAKQGRDVKRGMEQKASNGERPGQVPQGYMKVPLLDQFGRLQTNKDKIITSTEIDQKPYDLILKMWDMLFSGIYTPGQICRIANEEWGFRTRRTKRAGGKKMPTSMIYNIFTNPFYAGYISHNGELYKGNHKAMISLEQFDLAQRILKDRGKPRSNTHAYSFTGLIRCGECGCSVVGKSNTKYIKSLNEYKTYVHYHCTRKSQSKVCTQKKYTRLESIENQIREIISQYQIVPEFKDIALSILRSKHAAESKFNKAFRQNVMDRKEVEMDKLNGLIEMRALKLINDSEYTTRSGIFKQNLRKLDEELIDCNKRTTDWLKIAEDTIELAFTAASKFSSGTILDKRKIITSFSKSITLMNGKLTIEPNEWLKPLAVKGRTKQKYQSTDIDWYSDSKLDIWRAWWDSNPRHAD